MKFSEWMAGQPGLSVATLATECGVRRDAIYKLLRGEVMPKAATAAAIERITGGAVTMNDHQAARLERLQPQDDAAC